ncbi:MAG TPA: hypothetical protein ENO10_00975 [Salinimicrobium catena]|uniref:Uncharacterized protein n=1 Tax=Salinimicrobium catena TaxID=390640 RepID=A0A7C2RLN2_9FLAO|nr:hypothetical protein [Salinimicrobium catena]
MSQYQYTITFTDSEMIMLREALKNMIKECDKQLQNGPKAPYWAHKRSAARVLHKLYDNVQQVSGNNFDFFNLGNEEE